MCEFCVKHGEGERWYLQAKNYSEDLLSDLRRRQLIGAFADPATLRRAFAGEAQALERLDRLPWFIRAMFGRLLTRKMKKLHFGQVVPIEEIERIFAFANSIVRLACICRKITRGVEKRSCYGISLGPDGGELIGIFRALGWEPSGTPGDRRYEILTKDEALAALRDHEREGLCHTIWTFRTPFIGAICNCDRADCLAMSTTIGHAVPIMFRAEFVATIEPARCTGCRHCMGLCQFGALSYSAAAQKAVVDQTCCYGCGVCRSGCRAGAIKLGERARSPVAAHLW